MHLFVKRLLRIYMSNPYLC